MLLPRSLAFTITLVLIRTVVVVVVVVVNINILPVAERNKLLILLVVPAVLAVIYILKTTSWPEQGFDVSKQRDGHQPTALVTYMVPLQVFPGYPPTGLSTYRVLLPRSLAFTITLVLIQTVVVVVVVVNINFLQVAERNKLLILLAVPAVLAVILLVLPAVLAVLLLVLLVLLTSQS